MTTNDTIILARKHLGGTMGSSSRLCLADAVQLQHQGDLAAAKARALKSLAYSIGIGHPDYARANR